MDDGTEVDVGADPFDPDTDDDGLLDGPDGLGDEDDDGIIDVLDPTDDRVVGDDDDDDVVVDDDVVLGGGPECGCEGVGRSADRTALALLMLPLAGLLRRRR